MVYKDKKVLVVLQELWEIRENKDKRAPQDHQVTVDFQEYKETSDQRVPKEKPVPRDNFPRPQDQLDCPEVRDKRVNWVRLVTKGTRASKEYQG